MNSLRECFANKLMHAGDCVGATLTKAGFLIKKNYQRNLLLNEAIKETDSIKILVTKNIFQ